MVHRVALLALPLADVAFLPLGRATATVETAQSLLEKGRHSITLKGVGVIRDQALPVMVVVTCWKGDEFGPSNMMAAADATGPAAVDQWESVYGSWRSSNHNQCQVGPRA